MPRIPIEKQELKRVDLWKDKESGVYFFRLEYLCENDAEIYRLIFPKVETGIPIMAPDIEFKFSMFPGNEVNKLKFNLLNDDSYHVALPDENGNYLYRETVSVKSHEMTVEEIENKLGYKIKIVSKEDKK